MPQEAAVPSTRWAWVEVDQGALRRNVRTFTDLIGDRTQLMSVVKADAYGHGAVQSAKVMRAAGASQFAVATVREGVILRDSGIEEPILILSEPPIESIDTLVAFDLMPAIQTFEFALAFGESAAAAGVVGKYHLAIDTGMTRFGVLPEEAVQFRSSLDFHRGLECAGVFTHFATADSVEEWDFDQQHTRFCEAVAALEDAGLDHGLVHCDNTPATILRTQTHHDMVRVGVGLYGLHPAQTTMPRITLEPVMSVRARVTRVVYPPVGQGVGYGLVYRVPKQNIQIATIPVGYADGLSRNLSGRVEFLVGGRRVRQVGNICMDACMFAVDVNSIRALNPATPVEYGDTVTIIGRDGEESISLDSHASMRDTINYEVACDFGMRLERVYV